MVEFEGEVKIGKELVVGLGFGVGGVEIVDVLVNFWFDFGISGIV